MNKLYINLINFNSDKLAGVGYFFKRIISNLDLDGEKWDGFEEIIILSNKQVDPLKLFNFKKSAKIRVINSPYASNFLIRIFYEQLILPFLLIRKKGVFFSPTPAIPLLIKVFNKQLITIPTIHDMIPFKIKNKYSLLRGIYVRFISVMSAKVATKIITVSEYSKKDICEIANVSRSKVNVVYNFIPELTPWKSDNKKPYLVTICTIEPGKNIENMLKGFKMFISDDRYSHFKYKIIGQFGWQFNSVLFLAKDLNIEGNVEFLGYLNDSEKNRILKESSGMIYLSKYEGFGIPPLEAMYFNKVSIVSNNSSLPEVVGNAGIAQDPDDISQLMINLRLLVEEPEKYSINIPNQLLKFDPTSQISRFESLLLENYGN